jgi:hypothetical protein
MNVQELYGAEFLLTTKVNQEALENLFSQIRTCGGLDDHTTPLNALFLRAGFICTKKVEICMQDMLPRLQNMHLSIQNMHLNML